MIVTSADTNKKAYINPSQIILAEEKRAVDGGGVVIYLTGNREIRVVESLDMMSKHLPD